MRPSPSQPTRSSLLHFRQWSPLARIGAVLVGVAAVAGGLWFTTPDCADGGCLSGEELLGYAPPEPPRIYDHEGQLVGQLPGERRLVVPLEEIPAVVKDGFVAVEDRRFWRHGGVDFRSIPRAALANALSGEVEQGASTITMQLVRNVFDVRGYGRWRRKLVELRFAANVERLLTKEQILGLYLNQIYLGGGVYGVETAARSYFGKPVSDLTTAEAALLIGLAKNPEGYNPRKNPERALERRALVLDVLERTGVLTAEAAEAARWEKLALAPEPDPTGSYYFAAVDRQLRELFPDPDERHGLRVHTGLDAALQASAKAELVRQIEAVEAGEFGRYRHPVPEPEGLPASEPSSQYLQGMVVALDPASGAVRALVGGRDFRHSEFDRALQARRQPGSAFKALVWTAALEQGLALSERVETSPMVFRMAGQEPWAPEDGQSDGAPLSVREALVRSSNLAAVRIGQRAGAERIAELGHRLGLSTEIPQYPSMFLGAADVIPAELVAAYAAFGNGGMRIPPHLIERVENREGEVLWAPDDKATAALDPAVAYLMLDALQDVVDHGTGWRVRQAYQGLAAGKTGTTDGGKDVWFVGMTPTLVAGVWLGFDEPKTIVAGASGGLLAAPVWGRMIGQAGEEEGALPQGWRRPENVVTAMIDTETGLLATTFCAEQVQEEIFLLGTAPTESCPAHQADLFERVWRGIANLVR